MTTSRTRKTPRNPRRQLGFRPSADQPGQAADQTPDPAPKKAAKKATKKAAKKKTGGS